MSNPQLKTRSSEPRPASIDEFFAFARRKAPGPLKYRYDELIDGRALRPGEVMRVVSLIRGDGYREHDSESAEVRCAAAYVAARIGLDEAVPVLRRAVEGECGEPIVKYALVFALECLEGMRARGTVPDRERQLISLLQMRDSAIPAERRFADIVMEKAAIRYGTVTSW